MIWEEPAVSEVYRKSVGSSAYESDVESAMMVSELFSSWYKWEVDIGCSSEGRQAGSRCLTSMVVVGDWEEATRDGYGTLLLELGKM